MVEQHKRSEEALTEELKAIKVMLEKKMENVDELTGLLNSRVMELEADIFFLNGDLEEQYIVEEQLRQMITQLRQSCLDEKKRQDREGPRKTRIKKKVLTAFQWEENNANPVLLRAVCDFWYALSGSTRSTEGDQWDTKKRISQRDVMKMWKEVTFNGCGGKMRKEIQQEFIRCKNKILPHINGTGIRC
jgi:hypothetical protein